MTDITIGVTTQDGTNTISQSNTSPAKLLVLGEATAAADGTLTDFYAQLADASGIKPMTFEIGVYDVSAGENGATLLGTVTASTSSTGAQTVHATGSVAFSAGMTLALAAASPIAGDAGGCTLTWAQGATGAGNIIAASSDTQSLSATWSSGNTGSYPYVLYATGTYAATTPSITTTSTAPDIKEGVASTVSGANFTPNGTLALTATSLNVSIAQIITSFSSTNVAYTPVVNDGTYAIPYGFSSANVAFTSSSGNVTRLSNQTIVASNNINQWVNVGSPNTTNTNSLLYGTTAANGDQLVISSTTLASLSVSADGFFSTTSSNGTITAYLINGTTGEVGATKTFAVVNGVVVSVSPHAAIRDAISDAIYDAIYDAIA